MCTSAHTAHVYVETADEGVQGLTLSLLITESGVMIRVGCNAFISTFMPETSFFLHLERLRI